MKTKKKAAAPSQPSSVVSNLSIPVAVSPVRFLSPRSVLRKYFSEHFRNAISTQLGLRVLNALLLCALKIQGYL